MAVPSTTLNQVEILFVGYFNRAGDPTGVSFWTNALNTGAATFNSIAALFSNSPEARGLYPYLASPLVTDPTTFVQQVYHNLLNRVPDVAGQTFWVSYLNANNGNPTAVGTFIATIIQSAVAGGTDNATIQNKAVVATDFTQQISNHSVPFDAAAAAQSSTELAGVTSDPATVAAAEAATLVFVNTPPAINLTIGVDTGPAFTSTKAGQVFNALPASNPPLGEANTLNAGDNLQDTVGDGVLNYTAAAIGILGINPPFTVGAVTMNGVNAANITNFSNGKAGFFGNITGLKTVTVQGSSDGNVQVGANGVGNGLHTALNTVNIKANQSFAAFFDPAALAGGADTVDVNITGPFGTKAAANFVRLVTEDATSNGYEIVNISATGPTFLQLGKGGDVDQSTTTVSLSGAGKIELSAGTATEFKNVKAIDATGNSGGVTITGKTTGGMAGNAGFLATNTALTSFKGGSGPDLIDLSNRTLAGLAAFTALDGGAGRDTLIVDGTLNFNTTPIPDTAFEIMQVSAGLGGTGGGIVNWTNLGPSIDTLQLLGNAAGDVTLNNVPNGATLDTQTFSNDFSYTVNGPAGTADVFNLKDQGAPVQDFNHLVFNGFEVVNWTSTAQPTPPVEAQDFTMTPTAGGGSILNIIDNSAAGPVTDLEIFGTTNVTTNGLINITGTGTGGILLDGLVTALKIDAHTFGGFLSMGAGATGPITILGTPQADLLKGSVGSDTINTDQAVGSVNGDAVWTELGKDTVNLGAGHDRVHIASDQGNVMVDATNHAHQGAWGLAQGAAPENIFGTGAAQAPFLFDTAVTAAGGVDGSVTTVNAFTAGTAADADQIILHGTAAGSGGMIQFALGSFNSAGGQAWGSSTANFGFFPAAGDAIFAVANSGVTQTLLANADVIVLNGANYANAGAMAAGLHTGGFSGTNLAPALLPNIDDQHTYVMYNNNTGGVNIADVDFFNNSGAATSSFAALNEYASDVVTITGTTTAAMTTHNIQFA